MGGKGTKMKFGGGCQCGAVRYEVNSNPIIAYCCHCTDCQRQSSSAFGMSVWFPTHSFKLTSGILKTWKTNADSGNEKVCNHCADCGTRIHHGSLDEDDVLSVKGGSLDDICQITPIAHIWTRSAQPWILWFISDETCHETQPDSFDDLIARFQSD